MNTYEVFIHIYQGCFAGTGAIVRLPQCQWSKPGGYGKISQCITTTKHSKAKTVCIFLGIYCIMDTLRQHETLRIVALLPSVTGSIRSIFYRTCTCFICVLFCLWGQGKPIWISSSPTETLCMWQYKHGSLHFVVGTKRTPISNIVLFMAHCGRVKHYASVTWVIIPWIATGGVLLLHTIWLLWTLSEKYMILIFYAVYRIV